MKNNFIDDVEYLKFNFFRYLRNIPEGEILSSLPQEAVITGSGRAALRLIFEYYRSKGIISDRNDAVLVPSWMCQSVLQTMHKFSHPVTKFYEGVKGVLVYHQYGYPQKIDEISSICEKKKLFMIEDCAHAWQSSFKGKRLGTFGHASIFSFSKFFSSVQGGALVTSDDDLISFAKKRINGSKYSGITFAGRWFYEYFSHKLPEGFFSALMEMSYALTDRAVKAKQISIKVMGNELRNGALTKRADNYRQILSAFGNKDDYFLGLDKLDILPYRVPFFADENVLDNIANALKKENVFTAVYNFDVNRNVFDPVFKKCVLLPVHQGIDAERLEKILQTVRQQLKGNG